MTPIATLHPDAVPIGEQAATILGRVAAMANGRVGILSPDNEEVTMSVTEAYKLATALLGAAYHAGQKAKELAGELTVRVRRGPDGVFVTWRGSTERMRLSRLRKPRACRACSEKALAIYVAERTHEVGAAGSRFYHADVCEPCVERLAAAPTGLRLAASESVK